MNTLEELREIILDLIEEVNEVYKYDIKMPDLSGKNLHQLLDLYTNFYNMLP